MQLCLCSKRVIREHACHSNPIHWKWLPFVFKKTGKERKAQPKTLLMAKGNEEDIANFVLQWRMHTQEKNF